MSAPSRSALVRDVTGPRTLAARWVAFPIPAHQLATNITLLRYHYPRWLNNDTPQMDSSQHAQEGCSAFHVPSPLCIVSAETP